MLTYKYELIKMEQNKSITEIFTKFIDIKIGLKSLEKFYPNSKFVRKINFLRLL